MKAANKSLWGEIKYCPESHRRVIPSFMVQIPMKGEEYKEEEGKRARESD